MENKTYIFDSIRKKRVLLTPEESVRQQFIQYLINEKHFPVSLMKVEMMLKNNVTNKRCDIVVYGRDMQAVAIVECKAQTVKLTQDVFEQIAGYNLLLRVNYLIITNGVEHYCSRMNYENNSYSFLKEIPEYSQLLD